MKRVDEKRKTHEGFDGGGKKTGRVHQREKNGLGGKKRDLPKKASHS